MPDGSDTLMTQQSRKNLFVFNGGFLTQGRVRRILELAGYDIRLGKPGEGDAVGVWGQSPTAGRGEAVAERGARPVVRVEDAFLRSVLPGRTGEPPLGLLIDRSGVHFDPSRPSDLETLLATHPLDEKPLLDRAKAGIQTLQDWHLTKYAGCDPDLPMPEPGYVLVIDQTRKDAAVTASGCDLNSFRELLTIAQLDHPHAEIVIKTHPETAQGLRKGYYTEADLTHPRISLYDRPASPWKLMEGAIAVYTVSSQMGFEAILAGHRPVVLGQPFYMGWGLTDDRKPLQRRRRNLTRHQLFAAAMLLYPTWYDPYHDRLTTFEEVTRTQAALARAWREDRKGWVGAEMRAWKRPHMQRMFGTQRRMLFTGGGKAPALAAQTGRRVLQWATRSAEAARAPGGVAVVTVEDGFLRSRGLGAKLVPPLSLALDDLGPHYDPSRPSRLEKLIGDSPLLPQSERLRAVRLIERITGSRLSKYNLGTQAPPELPEGRRILVPGQVEDDASVLLGAAEVGGNLALLEATRAANPAAVIVYKPHPDVEAGLRPGRIDAAGIADEVLHETDPVAAIEAVDEVWTMTSLLGFEALLRGKKVTCLGTPFYAGWGLTDDRALPQVRRGIRIDIADLAHAALIGYPRYHDPVTDLPCPAEVIVERLIAGEIPEPGRFNRALSRVQGMLAGFAPLWR